jgi:hypothetical protein
MGGALGVAPFEFRQSLSQAASVELGDGEGSQAAFGATGAADQPVPAVARGLGQRGIHDLDEGFVAGHASRITQTA